MRHHTLRYYAFGLGSAMIVAAYTRGVAEAQGTGNQRLTPNLEAKKCATEALALGYLATGDTYQKTLSSVFPNGSKLQTYPGEYNMSGSSSGIAPVVQMRAAYTSSYLYLSIQWTDPTAGNDKVRRRFLFEGPTNTTGTVAGWSSQLNCDKVSLAFDIDGAADSTGTFATKGCTVGCHGTMNPTIGKMDVWTWKGTSNALGYMQDMVAGPTGLLPDGGLQPEARNWRTTNNIAAGPRYVWNPALPNQTVTLPNAAEGTSNLDPRHFLLKANMMALEGDANAGKSLFTSRCSPCHGALANWKARFAARGLSQTDSQIKSFMTSPLHPGRTIAVGLSIADFANVIAMFRGLNGVPGYVLQTPTMSAASLPVWNSKTTFSAGKYTVIVRRKLKTTYVDDTQFDLTKSMTYPFSIAIMDKDAKNHAGAAVNKLVFLP